MIFKAKESAERTMEISEIVINKISGLSCSMPFFPPDCHDYIPPDTEGLTLMTYSCTNYLRIHYRDEKTESGKKSIEAVFHLIIAP